MQLQRLRGHHHELISYAVIVRGGDRIWQAVDRAGLIVRADASDEFLTHILMLLAMMPSTGPADIAVESLGVQLFSTIDGSHYYYSVCRL